VPQVDELTLVVKANTTQAVAGLDRVEKKAGGLGKKLAGSIGKAAKLMVKTGLVAGVVVGGIAAKLALGFESSMAQIEANVGTTGADLQELADAALAMGSKFGVGADEAAAGLFFLQSAGLSVKDSIDALEVSAKLSAMGLGEMEDIANGLTTAMQNFGISSEEAGDIFAKAVELGKADPAEMGKILNQNAAAAAATGMQYDTLASTTAYLTRITGDANKAGTQMGGVLNKMIKPSQMARKAVSGIGLEWDTVANMISNDPFNGIKELDKLFADAGVSSNEWMGQVLEDSEAIKGGLALLNAPMKDVIEFQDGMADSAGKVNKGWDIVSDTAKVKLQQALQGIASALIPIGLIILDIVVPAIKVLGEWIQKGIKRFGEFAESTKPIRDAFGKVMAFIIALFQGDFGKIIATFKEMPDSMKPLAPIALEVVRKVKKAFNGLKTVLDKTTDAIGYLITNWEILAGLLAGIATFKAATLIPTLLKAAAAMWALVAPAIAAAAPFLLIAAAVALLVAGIIYAYRNFEWFRDGVATIFEGIKTAFESVLAFITPLIEDMAAFIEQTIGELIDWWNESWPEISETIDIVMSFIEDILNRVMPFISTIFGATFKYIGTVVTVAFDLIKEIIRGALNIIKGVIEVVMAVIRGDWGQAWEGIKKIVDGVMDIIFAIVDSALTIIKAALEAAWTIIKATLGALMTAIAKIWETGWLRLKDIVGSIWSSIGDIIKSAFKGAMNWVIDKINWAIEKLNGIIRTFNRLPVPDIPEISSVANLADGATLTSPGLVNVGDAGKETVFLPQGARVEPNAPGSTGGSGGMVINLNAPQNDPLGIAREIGWELAKRGAA